MRARRWIGVGIGILTTGATLSFIGQYQVYKRAQRDFARALVEEAAGGIATFQGQRARCPTRAELLAGGYVTPHLLIDPWGSDIAIRCSAKGDVVVHSAGPDRQFDTADDIVGSRS